MKIEKPTTGELREYFLNNKKYYDQLAAYYAVLDPEFYDKEFAGLEEKIKIQNSFVPKRTMMLVCFLIVSLLVYYYIPFEFRVDGKEYKTITNSFSVESRTIPDFQDGMDFYRDQQYENAIDVFQKINEDNSKYLEAVRMIEICRQKMDKPENSDLIFP